MAVIQRFTVYFVPLCTIDKLCLNCNPQERLHLNHLIQKQWMTKEPLNKWIPKVGVLPSDWLDRAPMPTKRCSKFPRVEKTHRVKTPTTCLMNPNGLFWSTMWLKSYECKPSIRQPYWHLRFTDCWNTYRKVTFCFWGSLTEVIRNDFN